MPWAIAMIIIQKKLSSEESTLIDIIKIYVSMHKWKYTNWEFCKLKS